MFIHLHLHTPYSFLDGASEIEALVRQAAQFGMPALALTDHDNVCAAVKFDELCRGYGIRPILGAELTMEDETHLTLLARDRAGYARLCHLLTLSHAHGGRLNPHLPWGCLPAPLAAPTTSGAARGAGLICLSGCRRGLVPSLVREHRYDEAREAACRLRDAFGAEALFVELQDDLTPDCARVNREIAMLARRIGVGVAATNNVHYATPGDFAAHEVLRCIGTRTAMGEVHPGKPLNAERYLKSPQEMADLFAWCPEALENTRRIADLCEPALPMGEEITPEYGAPARHADASAYLRHLTYKGAKARYREIGPEVAARLEHELDVICRLGYADYFLMVWSIVRWARRNGIRATGRGSAADSCVAYSLYLTDVDVISRRLPFARFLVPGKTPDIDIDFPSERRDDVFRHIIETYGEEHCGMVCVFHTFLAKSAVRDVGKALGLPEEALKFLSDHLHSFVKADEIEAAFERNAELKPYASMRERFHLLFGLCRRIANFPRHIGTHSSGIVISRLPLAAIAPLQPSARGLTQIWTLDKDDAETVGAIKFDVLSLRGLSAIGDAERAIARVEPRFQYDRIPMGDPETYRMFRAGAAVGSFQFESAAQMALAVVADHEHFEDLVAAVALIRPGPLRGNVVSRWVACRNGWASAQFLHPCLEPILAKTYGVIVFQEQVNDVVAAMTGCSDAEADKFRKSLNKRARRHELHLAREEFVLKTVAFRPEVSEERASLLFDQLEGWFGYGFTEGHAASFALTGYRSAYLSVHYPAEYFAGMMNHQPMGFFSANTLAGEARRRGVDVRPVDINRSGDKCHAEEPGAIRLGLRLVADLREEDIEAVVAEREARGCYRSLLDFCVRAPLHRNRLENLVLCGAFDNLHEHRRGLLWRLDETLALAQVCRAPASDAAGALCLGTSATMATPIAWDVDDFSPWDKFLWTWRIVGVCAEAHVMAWLREPLRAYGVVTVYEAQRRPHGAQVTVAGLNVRPHRPPTRSGQPVLFSLLEDETGLLQCTTADEAIDACTVTLVTAPAVIMRGTVQRRGRGVALLVDRVKMLRSEQWIGPDRRVPPDGRERLPIRTDPVGRRGSR